jgi:hypothetical protein
MKLTLKRPPRFKPRTPRIAAFFSTAVLLPDDREIRVEIRNVSSEGFMARTSESVPEGTRFGVEMPGRGIVRAQVRWCEGDGFGARFDTPLELQQVDTL